MSFTWVELKSAFSSFCKQSLYPPAEELSIIFQCILLSLHKKFFLNKFNLLVIILS